MSAVGWAARMPIHAAATAATLRLYPALLVLADHDHLWLRGAEMTDALDAALKKLDIDRRYAIAANDVLIPVGSRLPDGVVPGGKWVPIATFFIAKPQPSAPKAAAAPVHLRVVRSNQERPATVLLATLDAWISFALGAPMVRLTALRIAACADGRALVRGTPLPSIPGERFAEADGVAAPSGFHWSPAVDASIVRALFHSTPDDLILLHADGSAEQIHADEFAPASRSGAHLMQEAQ